MSRALIITPTGTGMFFDDAYDPDNHWRFSKLERTYDTCVVSFNDFVPEPNSYDILIKKPGFKYKLIPQIADMIKWEHYDYIGCWDDDYATDIQSVNRALEIARKYDFRLFQQSVISQNSFKILEHSPELLYMESNFIESGVPFFRRDMFEKLLVFLKDYNYRESEWGIDMTFCYYLNSTAHVIHDSTVKHMRAESWYNIENAYNEKNYLTREFFPRYMKEKFGVDVQIPDDLIELRRTEIFNVVRK